MFKNVLTKNVSDEYWSDAPIGIIQSGSIRTSLNETDHDGKNNMSSSFYFRDFLNYFK